MESPTLLSDHLKWAFCSVRYDPDFRQIRCLVGPRLFHDAVTKHQKTELVLLSLSDDSVYNGWNEPRPCLKFTKKIGCVQAHNEYFLSWLPAERWTEYTRRGD